MKKKLQAPKPLLIKTVLEVKNIKTIDLDFVSIKNFWVQIEIASSEHAKQLAKWLNDWAMWREQNNPSPDAKVIKQPRGKK